MGIVRRFKRLFHKLITMTICLGILGGMGYYYYAYWGKSDSARQARERLESLSESTREHTDNLIQRFQDFAGPLKDQLAEAIAEDHPTTGSLSDRLQKIKDQIGRLQNEVTPAAREEVAEWQTITQGLLDKLQSDSSGDSTEPVQEAARGLMRRIENAGDLSKPSAEAE